MSYRIRRLNCRVMVATGRSEDGLHAQERSERRVMTFTLAKPEPRMESVPDPGSTATEERIETLEVKPVPAPEKVDPQVVASRVYDLMLEEVRLGKFRMKPN